MLSGNSMWWQVRYNKAQNLMICYKSLSGNSYENYTLDPLQSTIYSTINWGGNDTKYTILPTLGTDYRHGGYGQVLANRWNGFKIVNANSPLIKGSGLNNGDILSMPSTEYDGAPVVNRWKHVAQIPATTETSTALSKDLKRNGFRFVGPTTMYALMQAMGMVNDHTDGCFRCPPGTAR